MSNCGKICSYQEFNIQELGVALSPAWWYIEGPEDDPFPTESIEFFSKKTEEENLAYLDEIRQMAGENILDDLEREQVPFYLFYCIECELPMTKSQWLPVSQV